MTTHTHFQSGLASLLLRCSPHVIALIRSAKPRTPRASRLFVQPLFGLLLPSYSLLERAAKTPEAASQSPRAIRNTVYTYYAGSLDWSTGAAGRL